MVQVHKGLVNKNVLCFCHFVAGPRKPGYAHAMRTSGKDFITWVPVFLLHQGFVGRASSGMTTLRQGFVVQARIFIKNSVYVYFAKLLFIKSFEFFGMLMYTLF